MKKRNIILSIIVFMISFSFIGCDKKKEIYNEKREYISKSFYGDLLKSKMFKIDDDYDINTYLSSYAYKNKDKYVRWMIEDPLIESNSNIKYNISTAGNGFNVICKFDYDYKEDIKDKKVFILSGKIEDYSAFNGELILQDCRIEKTNANEIDQLLKDKKAYYDSIKKQNQQNNEYLNKSQDNTKKQEKYLKIQGLDAANIKINLKDNFKLKFTGPKSLPNSDEYLDTGEYFDERMGNLICEIYEKSTNSISTVSFTITKANLDFLVVKNFLGFCATIPYNNAQPERAKNWIINSIDKSNESIIKTRIGDAKFKLTKAKSGYNLTITSIESKE